MFANFFFAPPNTSDYMVAGYIVIFSVMLIYTASLFLRRRKLEEELLSLEQMEDPFAENR